jgi:hypothetical protein
VLDDNTAAAVALPSLMVLIGILINNRQLDSLKNELKISFEKSLLETKVELLKEIRASRSRAVKMVRQHEERYHQQ